jgi:hypothetical protein
MLSHTVRKHDPFKSTTTWNKQELPGKWKELITEPISNGDELEHSNSRGISLLPSTYKILSNILLSRLTPHTEETIGGHQCGLWWKRSTMITYSAFIKYLTKNIHTIKQCISCIKTSRQLMIQLGGRSCIIFSEFGIPMKLVWVIKMCLTETYSRVWVGMNLSDMFHIMNGLKQGDAFNCHWFSTLL